ncbi:MAG TPA: hypothetical protein VG276_14045 [Actinomycetes bacterium]|nr:hypothetical protein [Actinomycetes bacterium]
MVGERLEPLALHGRLGQLDTMLAAALAGFGRELLERLDVAGGGDATAVDIEGEVIQRGGAFTDGEEVPGAVDVRAAAVGDQAGDQARVAAVGDPLAHDVGDVVGQHKVGDVGSAALLVVADLGGLVGP